MKDFVLRTPFFRIYLALAGGVLLNEIFSFVNLFLPFFAISLLFFLFHYYIQKSEILFKLRWLFGCGVFLFFIGAGLFIAQNFDSKTEFSALDKSGIFELEVKNVPAEKAKSFAIEVTALQFAADSIHFLSAKGNALLYLAKAEEAENLCVGDRILVATTFSVPKKNSNPEGFDFSEYLRRKGLRATAYADSLHWQKSYAETGFSIIQLAHDFREKLLNVYKEQQIDDDEFAVLGALTLGYTDEISSELYLSYSNSGALHILSVSGLHVGIVYVIFTFLLSFLDKTSQTRFSKSLIIIALLWSYAIITGLSPSVMRASLMFSIVAFGEIFRYKSKIYNSIFFSAFLLSLINPNYIFDISFQLSYMAVLGIVFFQPKIKGLFSFKNRFYNWCWDLFCVSVAAQIVTFPLGLFYFHKFSNHFLLTNFIAIPISTAIIYLAVLLFIVSPIPLLASWVGFALKCLLKAQNESIIFVDHLPFSIFQTWISETDILLFFAAIVCFTLFLMRKRALLLLLGLGSILCIQIGDLWRFYKGINNTQLIVYEDNKSTTIDFIQPNRHCFFTTDSVRGKMLVEDFWLKYDYEEPLFVEKSPKCENGFFHFEGKQICVITNDFYSRKIASVKLPVDYLIVGNRSKISDREIANLFIPKEIILDGSISTYRAEKIKQYCEANEIKFHSIAEKGAWIKELQ